MLGQSTNQKITVWLAQPVFKLIWVILQYVSNIVNLTTIGIIDSHAMTLNGDNFHQLAVVYDFTGCVDN